ncbi:hypothetical protein [Streptomyces sp. NPDC096030]|uniref:hypothetical protein n=1 Tax=Streptomyces sp. NPDC096030 TaxID=3155423 RepID=UPI00331E8AA9
MNILLDDAVGWYIGALGGCPTVPAQRSILQRFARHYPGRTFSEISTRDIAQFLYGSADCPGGITAGKSTATVANYRSGLKKFFEYGLQAGWSRKPVIVMRPVGASEHLIRLRMGIRSA